MTQDQAQIIRAIGKILSDTYSYDSGKVFLWLFSGNPIFNGEIPADMILDGRERIVLNKMLATTKEIPGPNSALSTSN